MPANLLGDFGGQGGILLTLSPLNLALKDTRWIFMLKNCVTCGKQTREYSEFPCAGCGEKIVRCRHCRQISLPYTCKSCNRQGP